MISPDQIDIYNDHLVAYRKHQGNPFKIRKDFSNFDEDKLISLQKLERFFENNKTVNRKLFFEAPHKIYNDGGYYDLDFYTKPRAVKVYLQYLKQLEIESPDSEGSMSRLKEGLKFVYKFCSERGLTMTLKLLKYFWNLTHQLRVASMCHGSLNS